MSSKKPRKPAERKPASRAERMNQVYDRLSREQKIAACKCVADKHGELTPALIVAESNPANKAGVAHELAGKIWSASSRQIAQQWREERAREILQSVQTELLDLGVVKVLAPYYIHDPQKPAGKQGYIRLASIKSDEEVKRDAMAEALTQAIQLCRRGYSIAVALGLSEEVDMFAGALLSLGATVASAREIEESAAVVT